MLKTIKEIGRGGFGIVYEVVNDHGEKFAKKTYHLTQAFTPDSKTDTHLRKRFEREANTQSGISHRNIVPILKKYFTEDPPSFLMPLAESSLEKDIVGNKTLNGKWIDAVLDIISGLEEIHSVRIFHRDLKPGNILRFIDSEDTEKKFYAISDFGLIALKQTQVSVLTQVGMKMTSDFYTAPEITQDLAAASIQSDIYSLGCIIHDFIGTEHRVPCNEINEKSEYGPILLSCTRKDPSRRFKSVSAVRDALLSLSISAEQPSTEAGNEVTKLLGNEKELSKTEWESIYDYIEKDLNTGDVQLVLRQLNIERISELINTLPDLAIQIGLRYAEWIRNGTFIFGECDGLAIRLEHFFNIGDISLQSECLMAMLYMGTSHNRWYVERKFFNQVGPTIDPILCKRLTIEFRADDEKVCQAIDRLENSISVKRENMHPSLFQTLESICTS